jgi:uncharacterized protein YktB (UPF0637 family)
MNVGKKVSMNRIESLICCGQELIRNREETEKNKSQEERLIAVYNYSCEKCGKVIRAYSNEEQRKKLKKELQEKALVDFWREQLVKRGYRVIKDHGYKNHGEVLLAELKEELSDIEMVIKAELKGNKAVIYLQDNCCGDLKLPLIQVPANTKDIQYFDYLGIGWFRDEKEAEPTPKDIWKDKDRSSTQRNGNKKFALKDMFTEADERVKRVEKGECYFLCGKILAEQEKKLVGKTTDIHCCLECKDKLGKAEFENGWDDCPEFPPYFEVNLTEPNWEEKLNSEIVEWATRELETSDLYAEIERRKSLHKKNHE